MDCSTSYRRRALVKAIAGQGASPRIERALWAGPLAVSVAIHDVAPATVGHCERLLALVEQGGSIPMTLLVVPRYHHQDSTPAFERWIEARLQRGDELALHGWTHLDESARGAGWIDRLRRNWYTAGEGEFAALDSDEASERLEAGRRWFAQRGWPLRGFVAPAWLLSAEAWSALRARPFDYTCTLTLLIALRTAQLRALHGSSIVFSTRTAWRRQASLAWNSALVQRQPAWMRFELHPADIDHAALRNALTRWLGRAREAHRVALTLGQLVDGLVRTS